MLEWIWPAGLRSNNVIKCPILTYLSQSWMAKSIPEPHPMSYWYHRENAWICHSDMWRPQTLLTTMLHKISYWDNWPSFYQEVTSHDWQGHKPAQVSIVWIMLWNIEKMLHEKHFSFTLWMYPFVCIISWHNAGDSVFANLCSLFYNKS